MHKFFVLIACIVAIFINAESAVASSMAEDISAAATALSGKGRASSAFLEFAREVMILKFTVEICNFEHEGSLVKCNGGTEPIPPSAGKITGSESKNGHNKRPAPVEENAFKYLAAFKVHSGGVIYAESIVGQGMRGETLILTPESTADKGIVWQVSGSCVRAGLCRQTTLAESGAAIDAYREYNAKARFINISSALDTYRVAIEICATEHDGNLAECSAGQNGIPENQGEITGTVTEDGTNTRPLVGTEYLSAIRVEAGGVITAEAIVEKYLKGETIQLTPVISGENIRWETAGTCVEKGVCRAY